LWVEHLRQHERVPAVQRFHVHGARKVAHYIAAEPE